MEAHSDGHVIGQHSNEHVIVNTLMDSGQFCLLLKRRRFPSFAVLFVFFSPRVETNKVFQRQIECNRSFQKKQRKPLVLFNEIIH